jgi:hypothetical protein
MDDPAGAIPVGGRRPARARNETVSDVFGHGAPNHRSSADNCIFALLLVTRLIARNHDGQGYPAGSFLNHAQVLGIG